MEQENKAATLTLIPPKTFVTPDKLYSGMYVYQDLIYPEVIEGIMLQGVVGIVGKTKCLVVGLEQKQCPYSSDRLCASDPNYMKSGKEVSNRIARIAEDTHQKAEAIAYCKVYAYEKYAPFYGLYRHRHYESWEFLLLQLVNWNSFIGKRRLLMQPLVL